MEERTRGNSGILAARCSRRWAVRWLRLTIAVLTSAVAAQCLPAAVYDLSVGDSADRALRLNVPDGLGIVRGLLIFGNGANGDSRAEATNPELVALAESLGFAVLATSHWGYFADGSAPTELEIFEAQLAQFATLSAHPEIVRAPWLPIGHSNGGQMSYGLNALRPAKTIAVVVSKGGFYNTARPSAAALRTPALLVAGQVDLEYRITAIRDLFFGNRPRGALWAWVEDQGLDHSRGNSDELTLPFVEAMARVRYPAELSPVSAAPVLRDLTESDGWLTDPESYPKELTAVASWSAYSRTKASAGWLPDRRLAFLFRAFATYHKASTDAVLSSGAGPVDLGTTARYTLTGPAAGWTTVDFFEGDTFLKRVTVASGAALEVDASLATAGYSVFHALVTFSDGSQRTTVPRRVLVRPAHGAMPSVAALTGPTSVALGTSVTLRAHATGAAPLVYQWFKDSAPLAGEMSDSLVLASIGGLQPGNYSVRVTNAGGTVASPTHPLAVEHASRLSALSVRTKSGPGDEVVILGLIVQPDAAAPSALKPLVIRGLGPTLGRYGLAQFLTDPTARLFSGTTQIEVNDDWDAGAVRPTLCRISLDNLEPGTSDAAFVTTRAPGVYTVHVGAKTAERGVVLAEAYEADGSGGRLAAMSVRAQAGTGEQTLIGGVIVSGQGTKRVIIRGLGPALQPAGVTAFLPDPRITLYSGTTALAANDNWEDNASLRDALTRVGLSAPPTGSLDAALLVDLAPGVYTVHLTGAGASAGVALIEIYEVP